MPNKVIFSERAYTALLAETNEKIVSETGGVFLGVMGTDVWYVVETIDPGPKSIFEAAYFEYDRNYINHLANKINKLYSDRLNVLGLWHRHPGSLDRFSHTDDGTNQQFARENRGTTISALVNVDPKFRLTMYAVTLNPLGAKKIPYEVDNAAMPKDIYEITPYKEIEALVNSRNSPNRVAPAKRKVAPRAIDFSKSGETRNMLARYLKKMSPCENVAVSEMTFENNDSEFEQIVEHLYDVLEFCEQKGIPVIMEKGNHNAVNLLFGESSSKIKFSFYIIDFVRSSSNQPSNSILEDIRVIFGRPTRKEVITGKKICFLLNETRLYLYEKDMFKKAWEEYSLEGRD